MNNGYTMNKNYAKVFYNESDVESAFTIAKAKEKGEKETHTTFTRKSESEGIREKKSWSQL